MLPGLQSTAIPMAHSRQSAYWGVRIDLKDRDNVGLSAVPMTQQTVNTLYEVLTMGHNLSFIDWLKNLATKKIQINLDS